MTVSAVLAIATRIQHPPFLTVQLLWTSFLLNRLMSGTGIIYPNLTLWRFSFAWTSTLSVCWVIDLRDHYVRDVLFSLWSLGPHLDDWTFRLSLHIFTWPWSKSTLPPLNDSQVISHLRHCHPSVPIEVHAFNSSVIPNVTASHFNSDFPILVASRLALPFLLDSDFILYLDADTYVLKNPFPGLYLELQRMPGALLMGVQDVAARGDPDFMNPLMDWHPRWDLYQQAALYFMRNSPELRVELRRFFAEWSTHREMPARFPEQDAVGL
jgi:hypothetical protein